MQTTVPGHDIETVDAESALPYSPLLTKLLAQRGITDAREAELFLHPDYERDIHDPFLLKDMDRAVERILGAIGNGEKIVFYTDYDTDGIPAGVLLHDFFKKLGYENFENYIPHRHREGYGLNKEAIEACAKSGTALLVTADCGITDNEEVAFARELGIDVIVTDHHLPRRSESEGGVATDDLPPAYAVVNPNRSDDTYPFKGLCGAGVAFKLVQALLKEIQNSPIPRRFASATGQAKFKIQNFIPDGWEKWLLDMVGIATISDMVPLVGENRALASYGMKVLRVSRRPGLQQLLRLARVNQRFLTEEGVGFVIGPRLNAASRMDTPDKAFFLLATDDILMAGRLAEELDGLNTERKGLVASILKEAKQRIARGQLREVIVMGNLNWRPGVLGLAANRLMEEHERPVFLWGGMGGDIKGSCRSDGRVNIVELMAKAEEVFADFGGHEASGGFSLMRSKMHLVEERLARAYNEVEKKERVEEGAHIDAELSLEEVTWDTYRELEQLAPFGIGNPRPAFLFRDCIVRGVRWFGKQEAHLELSFEDSAGRRIPTIQFFAKSDDSVFQEGDVANITAHIEKNVFRGREELRLRVVELDGV